MCRPVPASSSRRTRRIIPTDADQNDLCQSVENVTLKHRALHEEETVPETVSLGSSLTSRHADEARDEVNTHDSRCPITGRLTNVLDNYVVFAKVLGEGQYGCVRECIHRATRQTYACKSIDKSKIGRLDHLQREVHLLTEMNHRSIINMVDCYEDADYVHIVTEKYTGGELLDKIIDNTTDSGCYSEQKTAGIVKSLLEAVAYLHENDIAHRDIKPDNILFEDNDEKGIKLIDFGLSRKHTEGEALMTNPVGTAYYMSPELLKGKYGKSCDVWSVGTIVYTLLCGYPPFNGDTDPEIYDAIKEGHFHFLPEQAWSDKSDLAKDFIKCLLRRNPRKRFTAKEALIHPWIVNLGKKVQRRQVKPIRCSRIR